MFAVRVPQLPMSIEPQASMRVQIGYVGDAPGPAVGRIAVTTGDACIEFPIRGLGTTERLFTHSHYAMDFGAVRAGEESLREDVLIRYQGSGGSSSEFSGFSTAPKSAFRLEAGQAGSLRPSSCDTVPLGLYFRAPTEPGIVTGTLGWDVSTTTSGGVTVGTVFVELSGRSILR